MASSGVEYYFLLLAAALFVVLNLNTVSCQETEPKILFISFDGFRWDYLKRVYTPNFDAFAAEGVLAERGTRNAFVTKTFPNHWTLVTGMWEQSHGIVANKVYDPVFNETFNLMESKENDTKWWNASEPLWNTAERNGVRAGTFFWPGSNIKLQDMHPTFYTPHYNQTEPFSTRLDTVISWFTDASTPAQLVNLYYHEPDHTGHMSGPDSPEIDAVISEIDGFVGEIVSRLKAADLYDTMNIIITSDHGMASVSHYINISDLVNETVFNSFTAVDPGSMTFTHILPDEDKTEFVYNSLKNIHPNITAYLKNDIPDRWNYKNNRRVPPIMLVADAGYEIMMNKSYWHIAGNHGYDNDLPVMHPIFLARGPAFKAGFRFEKIFNSVDIHPLVCEILHITCPKSDGLLGDVKFLLSEGGGGGDDPTAAQLTIFIVTGSVFAFVLVTVILIVTCRLKSKTKLSPADLLKGDYEEIVSPLLQSQPSVAI